jgi:hypothetical protein
MGGPRPHCRLIRARAWVAAQLRGCAPAYSGKFLVGGGEVLLYRYRQLVSGAA